MYFGNVGDRRKYKCLCEGRMFRLKEETVDEGTKQYWLIDINHMSGIHVWMYFNQDSNDLVQYAF